MKRLARRLATCTRNVARHQGLGALGTPGNLFTFRSLTASKRCVGSSNPRHCMARACERFSNRKFMVRPERLLGLRPRPPLRCGPPPLRGDVQLRLRRSCRTRLIVCREFESKTLYGSSLRAVLKPKIYGAPGEIRTPDLLVRSQALYPTELRAQCDQNQRPILGEGLKASKRHNLWRRGRDSNPRWAFDPYALSRGAPSTTRPPLPTGLPHIKERGMIPALSSPGKAKRGLKTPFRRRRLL